jgi:hypothetical protein
LPATTPGQDPAPRAWLADAVVALVLAHPGLGELPDGVPEEVRAEMMGKRYPGLLSGALDGR